MTGTPCRIVFALTHPVQYMSPLFRELAANPACELTVLYASMPLPEQQGVGFGTAFTWSGALLDGYHSEVLAQPDGRRRFGADRFFGVDASAVGQALDRLRPDALVVPGWHSIFYVRLALAARRRRIPVLYRGDSNLRTAPTGWRRPLWYLRTWLALRLFDGWLSVGTRSRRYLERFGLAEPLIVDSPHAVAISTVEMAAATRSEHRQQLGASKDDFLVVFAGKVVDIKRPADVVRAAQRVPGRVVVAMIGSGPLEPEVRQLAETLGVRVTWCGFQNQHAMPGLLAAADCLVLPSRSESWGLVVNEALSVGTPCVVADGVGCADDLVREVGAGRVYPGGDVDALAAALVDLRAELSQGRVTHASCREAVSRCSMTRAADGILTAAHRLRARRTPVRREGYPRVVAAFGNMAFVSGVERMSFEVLRVLTQSGATVHCVVNRWDSSAVVVQAEAIGATWSFGYYRYPIPRRPSLRGWTRAGWDIARTSLDLWRDIRRHRATHVFAPEFNAVLRSLPALWLARCALGVRVVVRLGNAPEPGTFYRWLWRVLTTGVDQFVSNSRFIERELLAHGIDRRKSRVVFNTVPHRAEPWVSRPRVAGRVVFVGQIIPLKGLDLLLDAIATLAAEGIDASLDVVGALDRWEAPADAGYRDAVLGRAARSDLAGRVRFLGQRDDVPRWLAEASVHCMPSRLAQKEGFAVALLEAKRSGLPSVVTACGALPEMVRHREDGWVCAEATSAALADGLRYYLTNPDAARHAGDAARSAEQAYHYSRFASEWRDVFGDAGAMSMPAVASHR